MKDSEIRDLALAGARSGEFKVEPLRDGEVSRTADGGAFVNVCVFVPQSYIGERGAPPVTIASVRCPNCSAPIFCPACMAGSGT